MMAKDRIFHQRIPDECWRRIECALRNIAALPCWVDKNLSRTVFGSKQPQEFWATIFKTGTAPTGVPVPGQAAGTDEVDSGAEFNGRQLMALLPSRRKNGSCVDGGCARRTGHGQGSESLCSGQMVAKRGLPRSRTAELAKLKAAGRFKGEIAALHQRWREAAYGKRTRRG